MKKIVLAGAIVLVAAAAMFVSCAPKSCDCTYSDKSGEYSATVTIPKATMDALKLYTTINNCKDLQDYYNSSEYDSEYTWSCR